MIHHLSTYARFLPVFSQCFLVCHTAVCVFDQVQRGDERSERIGLGRGHRAVETAFRRYGLQTVREGERTGGGRCRVHSLSYWSRAKGDSRGGDSRWGEGGGGYVSFLSRCRGCAQKPQR